MTDAKIKVYGTNWCGDCRRTIQFFQSNGIAYEYINIDQDKVAEQFVIKNNRGYRSVPTIVFEDGSILVEPSIQMLKQKFSR